MPLSNLFFGLVVLWLFSITGFVLWIYRHINPVIKEAKGEALMKVLDRIIDKEKKNAGGIEALTKKFGELEEKGLLHIQKIGFVRFNPFNETGGDHSFSLAVLDASDTGFVLTALHTRERTRLYAKAICTGKGEHDLSKEELQAIKKAKSGEKYNG